MMRFEAHHYIIIRGKGPVSERDRPASGYIQTGGL